MNDISNFKDFFILKEAISLSNAKKLKLNRNNSGAYEIQKLNELFKDKDRLVYDLEITSTELLENSPLLNKINIFLSDKFPGFIIKNMKEYKTGIIFKYDDREQKQGRRIGKMLNSFPNDPEAQSLLNAFKTDPIRSAKQSKYKVVISRHPYDIAGMSTDRNWTSCMDLGFESLEYGRAKHTGINNKYVKKDIIAGSIVAYLVSEQDKTKGGKVEIRRPISRILMKPFKNNVDENDVVFSLGRIYGSPVEEFKQFLVKWLIDNLNKDTKDKKYELDSRLYDDDDEAINFSIGKTKKGLYADIADQVFDDLITGVSSYVDNSEYSDFFILNANNYSPLFAELRIKFEIPENINLPDIYFSRKVPQFLQRILNSKFLPSINAFYSIQSFPVDKIVVLEYTMMGPETTYTYTDEDDDEEYEEEYDEDMLEEAWSDLFASIGLDRIDYKKSKESLLETLKEYDFMEQMESDKEETSVIQKINEYLESSDPVKTSPSFLKDKTFLEQNDDKCVKHIDIISEYMNQDYRKLADFINSDNFKKSQEFIKIYQKKFNDFYNFIWSKINISTVLVRKNQILDQLMSSKFKSKEKLFEFTYKIKNLEKQIYDQMMQTKDEEYKLLLLDLYTKMEIL